MGLEKADDAGVYRLTDDLAIVQTVDFFTPIVDDPYTFGQIAAANALSDVYAMGGRPLTAMNIVCFPTKTLDISVLRDILRGGIDKLREAGVVLVGGHSVDDAELKYGLSVTGTVHPKRVLTKGGARPGDAAHTDQAASAPASSPPPSRGALAGEEAVEAVARSMAALNKAAAEVMLRGRRERLHRHHRFRPAGPCLRDDPGQPGRPADPLRRGPHLPGDRGDGPDGDGPRRHLPEQGVPGEDGGRGRHRQRWCWISSLTPRPPVASSWRSDAGKAGLMLSRLKEAGVADAAIVGEVVSRPAQRIVVD